MSERVTPRGRTDEPARLGAVIEGIIDPKAVEYHGIQMRSKLEASFALHMDIMGEQWTYEPAVYGDYLPDFQVQHPDGRLIFIEVKPTMAEVRAAARRMEVIWRTHPTATLIVACAEGCRFYSARSRTSPRWESWVERWKHG